MSTINSIPPTAANDLTQCYNKGCGLKFKLLENDEESCCFHPGAPIFHDAYKGWSCCNKKSTDFTTFLNTKGCSKGKHNPVKPEEPIRHKPDPSLKDEVIVVSPPKEYFMERPDFGTKLERIKVNVTQSLKDAFEALEKSKEIEGELDETEGSRVKIGEICKNNGCNVSYEGEHSNLSICKHHPGIPIFHEGLKYWHCCQRKTTDFDVFLKMEGCSSGSHVWIKKNLKKTSCRYDWHQTSSHVYITIYAKVSQPELSFVEANPIRINARIVFGENQEFHLDQELGGVIQLNQCIVNMAAAKVEMKLRKAEPKHWNKLFFPVSQDKEAKVSNEEKDTSATTLNVEDIDLSDI